MKTITPKDAFKLFVFLLILFSAKAFSHPRLHMNGSDSEASSKIGFVKKMSKKVKPSNTYSSAYKGSTIQSKKMMLKKGV
jgi:hypothetical protein